MAENMSKEKGKKRRSGLGVLILLAFVAVVLLIIYMNLERREDGSIKNPITSAAAGVVSDKVIEKVIKEEAVKYGASEEQIQQVLDSVSEEDKETVQNIVEEHMTEETVDEIKDAISTGDTATLIDYANESLSDEEKQQLFGLYEKYKDKIQ